VDGGAAMSRYSRYYIGWSGVRGPRGYEGKRHAITKEEPHTVLCTGRHGEPLTNTSDAPVELADYWLTETFCKNCDWQLHRDTAIPDTDTSK
jgi:hypothetical protein